MFLKLLSQVLVGVAGLVAFILQYKYSDKRTTKFRLWRNVFIALTVVVFISSLIITYTDHVEQESEKISLKENFDSVKFSLNSSKTILDTLHYKMDAQERTISELRTENADLYYKMAKTSNEIFNTVSGGDGYVVVDLMRYGNSKTANFSIECFSKYPMYDISITGQDYSKRVKLMDIDDKSDDIISKTMLGMSIGNMQGGTFVQSRKYIMFENQRDVIIDFEILTRNGVYQEQLRIYKAMTPERQYAIRIRKIIRSRNETKTIYVSKSDKFPVDEKGEPIWIWTEQGNIVN